MFENLFTNSSTQTTNKNKKSTKIFDGLFDNEIKAKQIENVPETQKPTTPFVNVPKQTDWTKPTMSIAQKPQPKAKSWLESLKEVPGKVANAFGNELNKFNEQSNLVFKAERLKQPLTQGEQQKYAQIKKDTRESLVNLTMGATEPIKDVGGIAKKAVKTAEKLFTKTNTKSNLVSSLVDNANSSAKNGKLSQTLPNKVVQKTQIPLVQNQLPRQSFGESLQKGLQKIVEPNKKNQSVFSLGDDIKNIANSQVNVGKINISDTGKKVITQTVEEVKPRIEQIVGKTLTNKEAAQVAENSSKILERTVGREKTLEWEGAMLRARQKLAQSSETGTVDKDYIETLLSIKTAGTDIARKLQSLSIGADPKDITSTQAIIEAVLKVTQNTDEILKKAQGVDFTDLNQATNFYREFIKPTTGEWIDLIRYNSMLSSPVTHIVNTFSNLVNTAGVKPIEKVISGGLDFLGSKIKGKPQEMFVGESTAYLNGYFKNASQAAKRFSDVMRGTRKYTNLDVRQMPIAASGIKGKVVSTLSYPLKLLEASDQFFMALSEGAETSALNYRASKGVNVGNIAELAQKKAEYSLFRQPLFEENQGYILDAVDRFTSNLQSLRNSKNPIVSIPAKFTVPFIQTPMNIFKQGIEYSPLGLSTLLGAKNKTQQLTKAIMGSAVVASTATLLTSNRLTWSEPIGSKEKNAFRAAGKQPYSVKIGDEWVSFQKLAPTIAFPMALVASLDDVIKTRKVDDNTFDLILGYVSKYSSFLSDQSYVKSIGDVLAAVQGGESSISQMISNYPQQLVPYRALGGWLSRLIDDTQRKITPDASFVEKQIQWMMTNIPGLSQQVPARVDSQGNPIKQPNRFFNAVSPVKVSKEDAEKAKKFEDILNIKDWNAQQKAIRDNDHERIQPIYDKVQQLKKEKKLGEAQQIVEKLSDYDYEVYKDIKSTDKTKQTQDTKESVLSIYLKVKELKKNGKLSEARKIVESLTDKEYQAYKLIKNGDKTK